MSETDASEGRIELAEHDVVGLRAANPGPFTLSGTNTWLVGRNPAWVIDPGPALAEHVRALCAEIEARGGLAGIALTHDHADHNEAVGALRDRFPEAHLGAARGAVDTILAGGGRFGPLEVVATPGHAPDHLAYAAGDVVFCGDAVLGEGSVFIAPYPGALAAYLEGLERLRRRQPAVLCPGHGPLVGDPAAKLGEYVSHRLERERRLLAALQGGTRTVAALLDEVWDDAPPALRPAAAWTLAAHLDKLQSEHRLPPGVERPELPAEPA